MPVKEFQAQIAPYLAYRDDPPSESDEDGDTSALGLDQVWAYPCKLASCPCYGKTWIRQCNFLNHLKDFQVHRENQATLTRAGRRQQALAWRYQTSIHDPPRKPPSFQPSEPVWNYSYRRRNGKLVQVHERPNAWLLMLNPMIETRPRHVSRGGCSADYAR